MAELSGYLPIGPTTNDNHVTQDHNSKNKLKKGVITCFCDYNIIKKRE